MIIDLGSPSRGAARRALEIALVAFDARRPWRLFDRPVFVIAAPRSGSTLLFDMLRSHPAFWAWAGEANFGWERLTPVDHPPGLGDTWLPETAHAVTRREAERVLHRLGVGDRFSRGGIRASTRDKLAAGKRRYLDKTPANSLRVAALAELWPDALFVHLHRDGPSNVASLLEAWDTWLGVRDPLLPDGRRVDWRMLLPDGWMEHVDASRAEKCAFQWVTGNDRALDELDLVAPEQVMSVRYADLVSTPHEVARQVCAFVDVPHAEEVSRFCSQMPLTRVVVSAPRADKWRSRYEELEPVLASLVPTSQRLGYDTAWAAAGGAAADGPTSER